MVILIGTLLGIGCGCAFGVIISRIIINKRRKELEEEKFRILEKQLSVVAEKCDRTHKACCILSDIVKDNYKTEEKERYKVPSDKFYSVAEKVDRFNMTQRILSDEDIMNIYLDFGQSLISVLSQQQCSIEHSVSRETALMQNCCQGIIESGALRNSGVVLFEDANKRLFHAFDWGISDDFN